MLKSYLDQLSHPIIDLQRVNLLALDAALDEIDTEPEVIYGLREGILQAVSYALNDDFLAFDLHLNQIGKTINSLKLKE